MSLVTKRRQVCVSAPSSVLSIGPSSRWLGRRGSTGSHCTFARPLGAPRLHCTQLSVANAYLRRAYWGSQAEPATSGAGARPQTPPLCRTPRPPPALAGAWSTCTRTSTASGPGPSSLSPEVSRARRVAQPGAGQRWLHCCALVRHSALPQPQLLAPAALATAVSGLAIMNITMR